MLRHESLEEMLRRKMKSNEDGDVVYEGDGPEETRTGSNLNTLISYVVNKEGDKPLDCEIFYNYVTSTLKVPPRLLQYYPWKKLNK